MKRPPSNRRLILGGSLAVLTALLVAAAGWWRYVTYVPPYVPPPELPRDRNGWWIAFHAASRPAYAAYTARDPWLSRTPDGQWPDGDAARLRSTLEPLRPALAELRRSLALPWQYPTRVEGIADQDNHGYEGPAARAFAAEANLAAEAGRTDEALERRLDGMELGARLAEAGSLSCRHWGAECIAISFARVEELVGSVSAAETERALARVRRIRREWRSLASTLEAERQSDQYFARAAMQASNTGSLRGAFQYLRYIRRADERWAMLRFVLTPRRWSLSAMDEYEERVIQEARKPVRQRVPVSPVPPDMFPYGAVPSIRLGPADRTDLQAAEAITDLALLEVALAVRLHYERHGRYPESLAEIEHGLLPAMPIDYWDQPIQYRLQQGRPLIYSFGPDGKDDRGRAMAPRFAYRPGGAYGDLVFGRLSAASWPAPGSTLRTAKRRSAIP